MKRSALNIAFTIALTLLVMTIHADAAKRPLPPLASGGVLDLGQGPVGRVGPIRLAGQWEFYWGVLLSPEDFRLGTTPEKTGWFSMPDVWNGASVNSIELGGAGFATFRLRLRLDPRQGRLALLIPYAFTAYKLWVDDQAPVTVGQVGERADAMQPAYRTAVAFIDPQADGEVELILQISNFMHAKGGMRDPIRLVAASQASGLKRQALVMDVVVFSCLLIMSFYHLVLFACRRSDRFNLYFALLCLFFGLRAALTGEVFLVDLFPSLDWQMTIRMEWLCVFTGAPLGIAFVRSMFPDECTLGIYQGSLVIGAVLALVTLLTPSTVFTGMFPLMTPLIGLMLGYVAWIIFRAALRRRFGAAVMLVSLLLVIATVVNDMLYANDLIKTGYTIPYGLLLFVFSQAMILAIRSAKAFKRLEETNAAYQQEILKSRPSSTRR